MPGPDGIEVTRQLSSSTPRIPVLILTTFDLDDYVFGALEAGAAGFLLKDADPFVRSRAITHGARPQRARRLDAEHEVWVNGAVTTNHGVRGQASDRIVRRHAGTQFPPYDAC